MLSSFYIKPLTQEQIDNLAGKDFSLFGAGDQLLTEGFNDISRYLRKRNTGTRQELAIDFTSCFEGTKAYQGRSAVPYESVFRSETGLLMQGPRNEVFNIYKKAAVKLREDLHLPDDHLAFELEFMAILSDRTAEALRQDDTEAALGQLEVPSSPERSPRELKRSAQYDPAATKPLPPGRVPSGREHTRRGRAYRGARLS